MINSNEHKEKAPFSDPMFNRGNNDIIKSHKQEYNDNFNYDYDYEEKNDKNIIIPIVSVIIVGILGYFGFNYLQSDNKKDIEQSNITKEIVDTQTIKEDKEDKKEIAIKVTPTPIVKIDKPNIKLKEPEVTPPLIVEKPKEIVKVKSKPHIIKKVEEKNTKIKTKSQKSKSPKVKKLKVKKSKVKKIKKVEKPKKPQYRVITIKKGDTLASISKRFYGNSMEFKRIIRANRDIKRASTRLRVGQKIIIPIVKPKKVDKKITKKRRVITVKKGDTLAIIAKRFYGDSSKFKKIINANYKIKNERSRLHIGQKIYVPR
jgi:nucleoid-associated protein YgaU